MTPAPASPALAISHTPPADTIALRTLQDALASLRAETIRPQAFSESFRSQTVLLAALPPRYTEALHELLDRLESSALFTEESCSFSQRDLIDHLQGWLDQAKQQLKKNPKPPT